MKASSTMKESWRGISKVGRSRRNKAIPISQKNSRRCRNTWKRWWRSQCCHLESDNFSRFVKSLRSNAMTVLWSSKPPKDTTPFSVNTRSSVIPTTSMLSFNSLNSTQNMWTVFMQLVNSSDFKAITKTLTIWSKESYTSTKWQEDTSWQNSSKNPFWRNTSSMMLLLQVSSCLCSSIWTSWARKDATELLWSTINFCWRSISTIPLLAFFAWTLTRFPANSMTSFLTLCSILVIILALGRTASTWCRTSHIQLHWPSFWRWSNLQRKASC